jgi:Stress responsive A/B Barrel Domain
VIQHVVLITFVAEATLAQREAVVDALRALPPLIPEIADYAVGLDLGLSPDAASLGIVALFVTPADYETYRDHPAHQRVITELIAPIRAGRAAIQFQR